MLICLYFYFLDTTDDDLPDQVEIYLDNVKKFFNDLQVKSRHEFGAPVEY